MPIAPCSDKGSLLGPNLNRAPLSPLGLTLAFPLCPWRSLFEPESLVSEPQVSLQQESPCCHCFLLAISRH